MDRIQTCVYNHLCEMPGEDVVNILTDYHGTQILDEGLYKHCVDEGIMEDDLNLMSDDDDDDY